MGAGRGPTGLKIEEQVCVSMCVWGVGISPFMLGWTLGMLTGYSANLVRSGSHVETERAGQDGDTGGVWRGWRMTGGFCGELGGRWPKLNNRVGRK